MARLDSLKTILQINDNSQDALIELLVDMCEEEYLSRTHQEEPVESIVNLMVVEKYNKLGNEGMTSAGYSGISESFESDYSEQVQKLIRAKTRLVML